MPGAGGPEGNEARTAPVSSPILKVTRPDLLLVDEEELDRFRFDDDDELIFFFVYGLIYIFFSTPHNTIDLDGL